MAGEEYARIYSWGNDPHRKGDYITASPCSPVDLPQTLLEPILVRYATTHGFKCRFDTTFISFEDHGTSGVTTTIYDKISGSKYLVRSKYLFGADGARSQVMKQLRIPLIAKPGKGLAINVLVKADLSSLVKHRQGNLHWIMQPDKEYCDYGYMAIVRMVKPWHEWMFILFPRPGIDPSDVTRREYLAQVKNFIGDESINAEILDVSRWTINEIVAETYSKSNIFCLGDAVHRHPPFNGLGSNTCIQDAFNLAWKISYVIKEHAGPNLLSTYSIERQPVGTSVITQANHSFKNHYQVQEALGMTQDHLAVRRAILDELLEPTLEGQKRRHFLRDAIANTANEFHGLGIEMNQHYTGEGVYTADEPSAFELTGPAAQNPIQYHMRSTYPGHRLPHAWLNTAVPDNPVSTIDLSGKGCFTIFTGIGGAAWRKAAEVASSTLRLDIRVHSIGFRQDWIDVYSDWSRSKEVEDSGAILVRPDRFIAWRAQIALSNEAACTEKLLLVLRSVLGLLPSSNASPQPA
jgi:2-polyprenyl-6-methoxyphenol hydroxylase-like FAD-dependent oxidoreductase